MVLEAESWISWPKVSEWTDDEWVCCIEEDTYVTDSSGGFWDLGRLFHFVGKSSTEEEAAKITTEIRSGLLASLHLKAKTEGYGYSIEESGDQVIVTEKLGIPRFVQSLFGKRYSLVSKRFIVIPFTGQFIDSVILRRKPMQGSDSHDHEVG